MADAQIQDTQTKTIIKGEAPESMVLSVLSNVILNFKDFDLNVDKFRYSYLDNDTQNTITEVMKLTEKKITEPNPSFNPALPESATNIKNITYNVGQYVFTKAWLNDFYIKAFNGTSANLTIEIFHLNAQLLQVVDNQIFVAFKDQPIVTPIQGLIPLPYSAPFADIGIRGAVPQETPQGSDELSWQSGYTEPYQRPTNRDGKYIKMGQYNQILYDITKSALTLQDNISILAGYINDEVDIKITEVNKGVQEVLNTPPKNAVLLTTNQTVAGLKNFTGVTDANFKTTPNAVANLKYCNGLPIKTYYENKSLAINTNYTISKINLLSNFLTGGFSRGVYGEVYLNNRIHTSLKYHNEFANNGSVFMSNKDVYTIKNTSLFKNVFYGN